MLYLQYKVIWFFAFFWHFLKCILRQKTTRLNIEGFFTINDADMMYIMYCIKLSDFAFSLQSLHLHNRRTAIAL